MRVAILIRKWSVRGGNERAAVELAQALGALGHPVTVLHQKDDGTAAGPVTLHHVPGISIDPTLAMTSFALSAKRSLAALKRAGAIDVSIGFNHSIVQDVYRLGGGTHAEALALGVRAGPVVDRAALWLERARFREGAYRTIVAPSRRAKDELVSHYAVDPSRVEVVWNGVDGSRFRPEPSEDGERLSVRKGWGVGESEKVILFVGQDLARKGFLRAVEVAERVGARLVYVGKAKRPRLLPRSLVWSGETRQIERAYRAADVLLAPSLYDPFGGVVLEAFASGLLAVATRRIGATERAHGTVLDGLFVDDPDDVEGLTRAVHRALDPAARPELLGAARRLAEGATQKAWGERMAAILAEAISRAW